MKTPLHTNNPVSGYQIQNLIIKCSFLLPAALFVPGAAQNTAVASGAWSNCDTWGNPPVIYRNTTDTKTVHSGVTVTADASWSTGALVLSGSGAVNYNGGIFTDFVNDQGADITCDAVYTALQSAGCASCNAYNAAAANQYVRITQAEYNAIKAQLSNVTLAGATDGQLSFNSGGTSGASETRAIAVSHTKAPASSYAVAFAAAISTYSYTPGGPTGYIKLKYNTSSSPSTGYADYGYGNSGSYPIPSVNTYYYLIKRPSQTTYSGGPSYMAYYITSPGMNVEGNDASAWAVQNNDANTLASIIYTFRPCFQVITTTVKQWK